jgi:pimeloyl-ACP methyl ester carboxylesterase
LDDFPGELIWVPKSLNPQTCTPEECIPCLFLISPSSRFLIFYLHSNAEDLGRCYPFCALLRYQFQVHVLAVEYPGYGLCPGGQADEESVTQNAFLAFRFIREVLCWPLDGILILGRSVGTGPALAIAMQQEVYGVILVSPFLSVQEVCRDVVGPLAYLINDRFPNKDRIAKIRSPLLVVHGKRDIVVPVSHGEKLYQACKSRKRLVCPELMQHNTNLHSDANFFVMPMLQFFSLPDYCFEELRVPLWAFDKRLSIYYTDSLTMEPKWNTREKSDDETILEGSDMKKTVTSAPVAVDTGVAVSSPKKEAEDRTASKQSEGLLSLGDNVVPVPRPNENAATAVVSKFSTKNGTSSLEGKKAQKEGDKKKSGEDDLPEPASEGLFAKVPKSEKSGPGAPMAERDQEDGQYEPLMQFGI